MIMGIQERKEREKEQRREEIINAAQKVFFEKGLQTATMDDIADSAEVSKGTLYLYYKSKEDLYLAVVMRGMDILLDMFSTITVSDQPAIKKISLFGDAYYEFFKNHRNYFLMMDFYETPQFHKQVSEEMKQVCATSSQKIWTTFFDTIQQAIDDGMMHPNLNARQLGIMFWSNSNGLMRLGDRDPHYWHELMGIDLEATLKLSNSFLLEGMMTDEAKQMFKDMLTE
jgi:TetR/AcrR family transcriptional regulator